MVKQIAVFIENRKGRLLELTQVLGRNKIDLLTLSIADTNDFGILRGITRDNDLAVKVLKEAGFTVTTTELIGVEIDDKPGGLANVLEILDSNNISIEYLYSFAHSSINRAIILFKVENDVLALDILQKNNVKILSASII